MTSRWGSRRVDVAAVAALLSAAAALRIPLLRTGFWRDEAYTYFDAVPQSFGTLIHRLMLGEVHPPLFFVLEHAWGSAAGWGDVALKVPALAFGLALVVATYVLGALAGGRTCATIAAAVVAFDPLHISMSAEARPYSLAALLVVTVTLAFCWWVRSESLASGVALVVSGAALAYTQYTGLIFLAAPALTAFFCLRGPRRRRTIALFALTGAALTPWIPFAAAQVAVAAPWKREYAFGDMPGLAMAHLGDGVPLVHSLGAVAPLLFGAVLAVAMALPFRSIARTNVALTVCVLGAAIASVVEAALSYDEPRYFYPFSALVTVFLSWGAANAIRLARSTANVRVLRVGFVLAATTIAVGAWHGVAYTAATASLSKSGIRDLAAAGGEDRAHTLYLTSPDYFAATLAYYERGRTVTVHGFARWNTPEIFDLHGYAEAWDDPRNLERTLAAVDDARRHGYREVLLVDGTRPGMRLMDQGRVRYSATWTLLEALRRRYPIEAASEFPGIQEGVTAYRLRLVAPTTTVATRVSAASLPRRYARSGRAP